MTITLQLTSILDANSTKHKYLRYWYQDEKPSNLLSDIGGKPGDELDEKSLQLE